MSQIETKKQQTSHTSEWVCELGYWIESVYFEYA